MALYESEDRNVSHPEHYQSENGLEVIDVIKAFTDGLNGIEATDTGNIIKYACRWKKKNGIQDLEKILWYTQHLIDYLMEPKKSENPALKKVTYQSKPPETAYRLPDIVFDTQDEAEQMIDSIQSIADSYSVVSVADIYDLANLNRSYIDTKYGWRAPVKVWFQVTDQGYKLYLPDCIKLYD